MLTSDRRGGATKYVSRRWFFVQIMRSSSELGPPPRFESTKRDPAPKNCHREGELQLMIIINLKISIN